MAITTPSNVLEAMFKAQRELIEHYQVTEGLPEYPLNMQLKKSQTLIKNFISRFVRELSEAYEELCQAYQAMDENDTERARQHIKQYNEEMADAWHFLCETFIYSGLDEHHLDAQAEKYVRNELKLDDYYRRDAPLTALFKVIQFLHQEELVGVKRRPDSFSVYSMHEVMENPLMAGGRQISYKLLEDHSKFLWAITHEFNQATNRLKNTDHRQSESPLNVISYNEAMFKALITFVYYNEFAGLTEIPIYNSFMAKNIILHERIKNGY